MVDVALFCGLVVVIVGLGFRDVLCGVLCWRVRVVVSGV